MGRAYPDTFVMNRAMREAQMTSVSDDRIWRSYDSGPEELERSFAPVLRAIGFSSFTAVAQWVGEHTPHRPTGLELAGQGKTFRKLGWEALANCLAIPQFLVGGTSSHGRIRRKNADPPVTFVSGDIAKQETWDDIQMAIQEELADPPNLILFTPAGGMSSMPETPDFYESVLIRSLELADPGPIVMVGEMTPQHSHRLEQRLLAMQHHGEAQVSILAGREYGLFALKRD